jgi:RNA polymerase subunit RPABC4/transcription elongation factor Spt4
MSKNNKMTTCKSCGKELAKSAKTCPSCGAKNKKPIYKRWFFWLIAIIILIFVISATGDDDETIENEAQEIQTEEKEVYSIGEVVTVGDIDWEVLSATNIGTTISSENMFIDDCVTNSGEFIDVVVKVTNNRNEMYTITGVRIEDNQGRKFTESSDVYMCVDDSVILLENINPGISKTFRGIFEVPADAEGLVLVVDSTGSVFSGETNKYISLGL